MSKEKKIKFLSFNVHNYPEVLEAAQAIAKETGRTVHNAIKKLILDEAERLKK